MLYDRSRQLFPEFSKDFEHEDKEIHNTAFVELKAKMDEKGISVGSEILNIVNRVRDKAAAAVGALASDATGEELGATTHAHSVVTKALENERASKALARRLWLSLCAAGKDAVYKQDILNMLGPNREDEAEEIFHILDRDGNEDVSLDDMTAIVVNCGRQRKDRASSIRDISDAIAVLDKILSVIVIIAIACIYALAFSSKLESRSSQIWVSFASLSFSIGGTVTEFFACCIFLFVKHPYDVGDRVDIGKQELVVKQISLMYSIFKRVDTGSVVQIPHNIANTLWIENISRSKAMKERVKVKVCFGTKMEEILALRKEMEKFVNAPENRHDFLPDFDIEITSVEDLFALELRIELRHKSNWANESLRLHRRNKFMCELLAAFRRIPIERPGGNWGPANPSYMCELTNQEANEWQKVQAEKTEATRLYPTSIPLSELLPTRDSSPAQAMFPGLRQRTPGSAYGNTGRHPSGPVWSPL
ncbi:uncharacterized family -like [Lecanosticta acicola]|uniref:Uncharacterized family -like n=1 Tax=Lecanosticta acicola TaxID=111012 RepID=A0AAI9E8Y9_9PEZI|nr:uncharacterized family -like [Lecanosticta acicola]